MTKRIALLATLILSLVLLPGCPGVSPLVGIWIFTLGGMDAELELMANGDANSYVLPGNPAGGLGGTLAWEAYGTEFILRQDAGPNFAVFVGRISGDTSISGVWIQWEGQNAGLSGTWTAVKQ